MRLSARNQIPARVTRITTGEAIANVELDAMRQHGSGWHKGKQSTFRFSEGFSGPQEPAAVRLGRPGDVLGRLGVHSRPYVSTAVVGRALAVRVFVPRAERRIHGLHRYRVYRLFTIHWSLPASVRDRVGGHPVCHSRKQ